LYDLDGLTWDDSGDLPTAVNTRLAGVRVEVLDGPKAGTFSISDAAGSYRLPGMPAGTVQLRATKDGYDPHVQMFTPSRQFGGDSVPNFTLGQPPHTLWGDVFLDNATRNPVVPSATRLAAVRVEILDGANGGKVTFSDESGRYRFDDLVTSPPFNVRFTKTSYQALTITISNIDRPLFLFRHNQQRHVQLLLTSQSVSTITPTARTGATL
jgi:hypothetical protein